MQGAGGFCQEVQLLMYCTCVKVAICSDITQKSITIQNTEVLNSQIPIHTEYGYFVLDCTYDTYKYVYKAKPASQRASGRVGGIYVGLLKFKEKHPKDEIILMWFIKSTIHTLISTLMPKRVDPCHNMERLPNRVASTGGTDMYVSLSITASR